MTLSNVTNGLADACATITARRPERFVAAEQGGVAGRALRPLVSAELARGVCAVIPLFFYAAEIAAAKMLLFFRKSEAMDIFTLRDGRGIFRRVAGSALPLTKGGFSRLGVGVCVQPFSSVSFHRFRAGNVFNYSENTKRLAIFFAKSLHTPLTELRL